MGNNIKNDSYILVGPVGVGKSILSHELSHKTNMPYINTDALLHCPRFIKDIEEKENRYRQEIIDLNNRKDNSKNLQEIFEIRDRIKFLENEINGCIYQKELRTLLPNLCNLEDLGFNGQVAGFIDKNYGKVASHFYIKQFENKFLKELLNQLPQPCVIDMGGGLAVSLDDEYKQVIDSFISQVEKYDKTTKQNMKKMFKDNFNFDLLGFDKIEECLKPFKNVVSLQLPQNYKENNAKANDVLNEYFIKSNQYDRLGKINIVVEGLVVNNTLNHKVKEDIVKTIQEESLKLKIQDLSSNMEL